MRTRVVQVDTQKITAARRGRDVLKLNLFDDAVVEVQIKRVRPTRNGYFISGTPRGTEWGEVRLVVNGPIMVGTVVSSEGTFTIRSAGSDRHIIRQIDPSKVPFECDVEDAPLPPAPGLPAPPQNAISSIDPPPPLSSALPPPIQRHHVPTEDGSEIRILMLYTPAMQARQGGPSGMRALIDLLVQSANQAFEDGGINPRLVLAHTAMVDYVSQDPTLDLYRLKSPDDGYMDEVHALRNKYTADLVHLLPSDSGGGSASRLLFEAVADDLGFAVSANRLEHVFVHELGHNMGMAHDRYAYRSRIPSTTYPYAFGYVNKSAFESGAPETARWRTIMSYADRCAASEFSCEWLLRFSNPDQTYNGDSLGVANGGTHQGLDGPADARLAINNIARWVGSFRSEACTGFTVSPRALTASVDGGELILEVGTIRGCLWEASSDSDFLTVTSDALNAGPGFVYVDVQENNGGVERSGTLTVAGRTIDVRQIATTDGVCGRTNAVLNAIIRAANIPHDTGCDEIGDDDLARITSLSLQSKRLNSLKPGDFSGLSGLERLDLRQNELTELPEGVFAGLSKLEYLDLSENQLAQLPHGVFAGLSALRDLRLYRNQLDEIPNGAFASLRALEELRLSDNLLAEFPDGVFAGLANLEVLNLSRNELASLPKDSLTGLSSLKSLYLRHNRLTALPEHLFIGLPSLAFLYLDGNQLTAIPQGIFAHLSTLRHLSLSFNQLTGLPAGLLSDLSNLESFSVSGNRLTELSGSAFSGLSSLRTLFLQSNQLIGLPQGVFEDLSSLERLELGNNQLTDLPQGLFAGLANLQRLRLNNNQFTELHEGLFAGLWSLRHLNLRANLIAGLPDGMFSGLAKLEDLDLSYNYLSHLPAGVFSGLVALRAIDLAYNLVDPLPLSLSLEKVGEDRFKAVASLGAPFALNLPVSIGSAGMIEGDASSLTIAAGALESASLGVTRVAGALEAVEVDLGALPGLPGRNSGYALKKDESLPLRILPSLLPDDAALTSLIVSGGTLEPIFAVDTANYATVVANGASIVTVTPATSNAEAVVAFLDQSDNTLADADTTRTGHQVHLNVGENTVRVRVGSEDRSATQIYTLVVTRDGPQGVCVRTAQLRDAIVEAVESVATCADVTEAHLSRINFLRLVSKNIASLKSGDFKGLTSLAGLELGSNELIELPADVFSGLSALKYLHLEYNQFRSLPESVFSGRATLQELSLHGNQLWRLPDGVFSGLPVLRTLNLSDNRLASMPAGIFSGLTSLELLRLGRNEFQSLPADLFSGLTALQELDLGDGRLGSLPGTVFMGLTALQDLNLYRNRLSSLPDGLFTGLTSLEELFLQQNTVDPLPLPVSLVKVGDRQFKAAAQTSAPFAMDLSLSISSAGTIEGGASTVTIPAGAVESALVGVTRVAGTEDAVSVDIASLPELPEQHQGYFLEKDDSLPREILPGPKAPPPGQVTGVAVTAGVEQLDVSWTAVADAAGYKVQWKSGTEEYDEARQAVLTGGDMVSYTITGLVAGTEYTMRVLATKQDADDGSPSMEATGTPSAMPASQVQDVAVVAGIEQLELSWTPQSDADGYKVQWKSNEEDFAEARQVVLTGGDTVSYTISGLVPGTDYTVRVLATKELADDGLPSAEVTGVPQSLPAAQAMGVEVAAGVKQLVVSWTAVSDASGYKVQWKSGEEDYDEALQGVLVGGDTVSYTITGLAVGAEYTVRVIATREHADEGLPSDEVTGTPIASAPAQVTGVEVALSVEQLEVSWTAVSEAEGYRVQWKSGIEDYEESRQAVLTGGDAVSYTLAGLTAGADYTVRVIATRAHADDGTPSEEVTGVPKADPPRQVTGVELTPGIDQLDVSWVAVADASGYKVQWKSGEEAYDESRQAVIASGDTVSHTLMGLTGGAEYTVRVFATKANADDGLPSDEVTGIPRALPPAQVVGVEVASSVLQLEVSWAAVSDADGYKVQWKSGAWDYDEERQVALLGGETVSYTIIDLTADTQYTVRVIAMKAHAEDGLPSEEVTGTPTSPDPDVNGDGVLDGEDAQVMYQAYASAVKVGDGETGGTAASRQTLLSGLAGVSNPSDDDLRAMLRKANVWRAVGVAHGGDINEDGEIDGSDAFVMYYAYDFADLVGDGETGGTARHRRLLLSSRSNQDDPTDADLKKMLQRANQLRADFN